MRKRSCFWKPLGSERVNQSQKLLKSAGKYFYPTFSSFWDELSYKRSLLVRSEILGLVINTLTATYEYSRSNRENLTLRIQMAIIWKIKSVLLQFYCIFGIYIKFETFWRKWTS